MIFSFDVLPFVWGGVGKTFRWASEMVPMQSVQGDLLALAADGTFDVIIHGCNCQNAMGAGIAKSIKHRFPAAYDADLATEFDVAEIPDYAGVEEVSQFEFDTLWHKGKAQESP